MKKYRRAAERRGKREALEDKRARRGLLERWLDQSRETLAVGLRSV